MYRFIAVMMLALALVCGGISAAAQKKKSGSSKSSSSVIVKKGSDGYPDIVGHTYRYATKGLSVDFKFTSSSSCIVSVKERGVSASDNAPYVYEDGWVGIYDPGVPDTPMFDGIVSSDGRSIKLESGYTMKLVN